MKKISRKAYSLLLLFAMIISIITPVTSLAEDVTGKVDISGVNVYVDRGAGYYLYIKDGVIQEGLPNPIVGNRIKFEYKWGISAQNLNGMKDGDQIIFNLPTGYYSFEDSAVESLKSVDGEVLGTVQILKNTIKVVLNEVAVKKQELTDGLVFATGKIMKSGTTEEIPIDDGVNIPPITIDPPGITDGDKEFTRTEPIYKNGVQLNNQNVIRWDNYLNNGNAAKRFNGEEFTQLKGMFFIDELQGPQKFGQLGVKTVFQTATSTGKASELTLASMDLGPMTQPFGNFFIKVDAPPGISVDEFKLKLIEEAGIVQKGTWGVIDEKTVVVYFGDIPDKYIMIPISQNINYAKQPLDELLKNGKINQVQYDKTLEHYKTGIEDKIIQFQVTIDAIVDEDTPSQVLTNESTLQWSDGTINSKEETVNFQEFGGGVEGIEAKAIKIIKKDDAGKLLKGMKFKIQQLQSDNSYEDYKALDDGEIVRETDAKGEVFFRKIEAGDYKIVEVDTPSIYDKPIYSPGNTFTIKNEDLKGIEFTVINPMAKIDIEGTKTWDHGNNPVEAQPKEIEVKLLQNDKETHVDGKTYSKKVTAMDKWEYKFEGLPKNDSNGNSYKYTVEETTLSNYWTHNSGTNEDVKNYDLHNIFIEPVEIQLEAKKYLDNELSVTPFNFEVKDEAGKVVATGTNDVNGAVKFPVIKISEVGEHKFTIHEVKGTNDGYIYDTKVYNAQVSVTLNKTTGKLEVTEPHYTDISGNELQEVNFYNSTNTVKVEGIKTWDDANNQDGKRPSSIKVDLYKTVDGKTKKIKEMEVKPDTEENWKYSFTDLPTHEGGKEITYTVKESKVPEGYEVSYKTENGIVTITNTYTPEKTKVEGIKTWDDANNQDGKRPSSITVDLYKTVDGKTEKVKEVEVKPDTEENWKYSFTDLPTHEGGKEITYTVKESKVPEGYEVSYKTENGIVTITNTYTPEKTKVEGIKTWDDANNQDGKRPSSITVDLYKTVDGKTKKVKEMEVKPDTEENWKYSFTDLPKYENGKEIVYSVKEQEVKGYITNIDGFNITNKLIEPVELEIDINKILIGKVLKAKQFKFNVEGISENTKDIKEFALNDADGKVKFEKLDLIFREEGTYRYRVFETKGRDKKIKYDNTEYTIEVIIKFENNILVPNVKVTRQDDSVVMDALNNNVISLEFVNRTTDTVVGGDKNK